jgi:putative sigma-54 modulation protein
MQIKIKATKIEISDKTREFIEEKIGMVEKYLGDISPVQCEVEVEKHVGEQRNGQIYRCEVNLSLPHELIRIEKSSDDLQKAIEKVKDHLPRSIKRYKEKRRDQKRRRIKIMVHYNFFGF